MSRVQAVKEFRSASKSLGTVRLSGTPPRFHVENMPTGAYTVIPKVSSEKRRYVPIGCLTEDCLCSELVFILPGTDLYHLGVLMSSTHMAWIRTVAGRLKSDYRYSRNVVYNNFPWPDPTPDQRARIEETAQGMLDACAKYPDANLADLYDEVAMPVELRRAHEKTTRP